MNEFLMKQFILPRWAICGLLTFCLATVRSGEITATMGGIRVVILDPQTVWGAAHVIRTITAVELARDGMPYLAPGTPAWNRYSANDGSIREEHGAVFTIRRFTEDANDRYIGTIYRKFPPEAITQVATVKVGDTVLVQSRNRGKTLPARVTDVQADSIGTNLKVSPGDATTPGDSGSLVTTTNGVFVGLIRSARNRGSTAIIPPTPKPAETAPAVTAPAPEPATK